MEIEGSDDRKWRVVAGGMKGLGLRKTFATDRCG
jgi:hypothetical protein